jgi:hypothetical protein
VSNADTGVVQLMPSTTTKAKPRTHRWRSETAIVAASTSHATIEIAE